MSRAFVWIAFAPQEVVHLHVSVVGRVEDESILQGMLLQGCQNQANLLIDKTYVCQVRPSRHVQGGIVHLATPS